MKDLAHRNLIIIFIAISTGIAVSLLTWQAKVLPWKYSFNYSYLPRYIVDYLDSQESLKLIPVIVFVAFEAMFIYTIISPVASILLLITMIPVMNIKFVSFYMNIYIHIIFLIAISTAGLCMYIFKRERALSKLGSIDIWGIVFLSYMWILLVRSHSLKIGVKEIFSLTALFLAYFSVRILIYKREDILRLARRIALVGCVVSIQAIIHFYLMKIGFLNLYEQRFYRAYTSFGDPTQLANFLIMSMSIVGSFYFIERRKFFYIILPMMAMGLFLTFSRSSWIAICLTIVLLMLFKLKGIKRVMCIPVLVLMAIGFVFMSQDQYVVGDRIDPGVRIRSIYARKDIIISSFFLIRHSPVFGVGPGNFSYFNTEYDTRDMVNVSIPNTYLHTFTISGLVGFFTLSIFLLLIIKRGFLYASVSPVFMGLYTGVIANLVHGCFENLFYNIISNWIFGLILGMVVTWYDESLCHSS